MLMEEAVESWEAGNCGGNVVLGGYMQKGVE